MNPQPPALWIILVSLSVLLLVTLSAYKNNQVTKTSLQSTPSHKEHHKRKLQNSPYFPHGVASFDPSSTAVIIWTRVNVDNVNSTSPSVTVNWEMATDQDFGSPVGSGTATTTADQDYTVQIDITGLEGYRFYYYRFTYCPSTSISCAQSVTGRTKTAPSSSSGQVHQVRFASVSCSSLQWGWFHAYDRLAEKDTVDAVLHLGDYIYEQGPGEFGNVRIHDPPKSAVTLEDYRTRYKQYRSETSLQRLHQLHPFINTWDDHEFVNDAWRDGSPQHDPATQGSYADRRRAAEQAYLEYLPFRGQTLEVVEDEESATKSVTGRTIQPQRQSNTNTTSNYNVYRKLNYGNLVELFVLDNRIVGRDEQKPAFQGGITMFLPEYYDPDHDLLGLTQMEWIQHGLSESKALWKVVVQAIVLAPISAFGLLGHNNDAWDGYQSDRAIFLDYIADHHIDNVVILTGDVHITVIADIPKEKTADLQTWWDWLLRFPWIWLTDDYTPIAVEFVVTSVTSATNFENSFINNIPFGREFIDFLLGTVGLCLNPHGQYTDTLNHGYQIIDIQRERIQTDIYFTGSPREETDTRPLEKQYQRSYFSLDGKNQVQISYHESSPQDS